MPPSIMPCIDVTHHTTCAPNGGDGGWAITAQQHNDKKGDAFEIWRCQKKKKIARYRVREQFLRQPMPVVFADKKLHNAHTQGVLFSDYFVCRVCVCVVPICYEP